MMKYLILLWLLTTAVYALSDPTMPPDWNQQESTYPIPKNIILSGIFVSDNQRSAILNGKSVQVGDFMDGYEISKISSKGVYLKNIHGTFMIPLETRVTTPVIDDDRESH